MQSFKCAICKVGKVVPDEKGKKAECDNCGTVFQCYRDDRFTLKKLGDKQYSDTYKELDNRQDGFSGLTIYEWESIANGGLTDKEQAVKDKENAVKEREQSVQNIIVTTTPSIDGNTIKEYKGIVTGQVAAGINVFKDAFSGIRNVVGGRSEVLQETMKKMREEALKDLKEEAIDRGANAVVGATLDFDEYAEGMLLLTITGTAVIM